MMAPLTMLEQRLSEIGKPYTDTTEALFPIAAVRELVEWCRGIEAAATASSPYLQEKQ